MSKNEKKYGSPKNDVISLMFRKGFKRGAGFCEGNIIKYITRTEKVSKMPFLKRWYYRLILNKGGKSDLDKILDYSERYKQISYRYSCESHFAKFLEEYQHRIPF